ncbi:asparaginase [Candidatus Symbiobacter mobilis]|nr:asparaginase [Candidatus Symbiobacter mobilis]
MQNHVRNLVVLGTGGTIAGSQPDPRLAAEYDSARHGIDTLVAALPALPAGFALRTEQVANIDSKDLDFCLWAKLYERIVDHLRRAEVAGVVVTHGTDTLEETAYFLHAALPGSLTSQKPVVLTGAMRALDALGSDGPANLYDAFTLAATAGAHGVMVACAGAVHAAVEVRKTHTYRLDAFSSGDAGPLGYLENGRLRALRPWPAAPATQPREALDRAIRANAWPRVEIVMGYAGGSAAVIDALLRNSGGDTPPLRGIVVAATGNGTLHHAMEAALRRACDAGVRVVLTSRCGPIVPHAGMAFSHADSLTAVQARVAMMLDCMAHDAR